MVAVPKSVGGNVVNFLELVRWAFKKKTPLKEAESPFKVGGKGLPEVGLAAASSLVAGLATVSKSEVTHALATKGVVKGAYITLPLAVRVQAVRWVLFALAASGKGMKVAGLQGVSAKTTSSGGSDNDSDDVSEDPTSSSPSSSDSGKEADRLDNRKGKGGAKGGKKGPPRKRVKADMSMEAKLSRAVKDGNFAEAAKWAKQLEMQSKKTTAGRRVSSPSTTHTPFSFGSSASSESEGDESEPARKLAQKSAKKKGHKKSSKKTAKKKKRKRKRARSSSDDSSSSSGSDTDSEMREHNLRAQKATRLKWRREGASNRNGLVSSGKVDLMSVMAADDKSRRAMEEGKFDISFPHLLVGKKKFDNKGMPQLNRSSWVVAWRMFAKVMETSHQMNKDELDRYERQMDDWFFEYRISHPQGPILYDEQFRQKARHIFERSGSLVNFAEKDQGIENRIFGGKAAATCVGCGSAEHTHRNCASAKSGKKVEHARTGSGNGGGGKQGEPNKKVCFGFQKEKGCQRPQDTCTFLHECEKCGGAKGKFHCATCKKAKP